MEITARCTVYMCIYIYITETIDKLFLTNRQKDLKIFNNDIANKLR